MKQDLEYIHSLIEKLEDQNLLPTRPLVTVLVSTFNHEKYIRHCIESILMQETKFQFEVIIKEDFSSDRTRSILMEYYNLHADKIRLWLCKENLYSQKLKPGLFMFAKGRYIATCEGDDYWIDPLKLQKQVDYMEANPDCVACASNSFLKIESTGEFTYNHQDDLKSYKCDLNAYLLRGAKSFRTCATMYRRDATSQLKKKKSFKMNGDKFLRLMLLSGGGYIALLPFFGAVYRKHQGGVYSGLHQLDKNDKMDKSKDLRKHRMLIKVNYEEPLRLVNIRFLTRMKLWVKYLKSTIKYDIKHLRFDWILSGFLKVFIPK